MLEHLQEVEVIKNRFSIEVRPKGINRNILMNLVIEKMKMNKKIDKIDFILVVSSKENV
jgi:hypothetical protein